MNFDPTEEYAMTTKGVRASGAVLPTQQATP